MPKKDIHVSIVIVSYNTLSFLKNCLDSIHQHTTGLNYEIIVVDNASTDGSREFLSKLSDAQKVKFLGLTENLGFGAGNNRGAALACGKYLLFLNSDTILTENSILSGFQYLERQPQTGVYSCRLTYADGRTQATGGYFPTLFRLIAWQLFLDDLPLFGKLINSIHPKASYYYDNCYLDWVTGAFMLIPKQLFERAQGFDERIFMYVEELELCYRLRKLGFGAVYRSNTSITHFGGASGGSRLALTLEIKNMVYFFHKHMPVWQAIVARRVFMVGCLLRWMVFGIIRSNEVALQTYRQAYRDLA